MKANYKRIFAEQASQHIKTLNESRDKVVVAANNGYEKMQKCFGEFIRI